jgi:hypothetical protein
LKADRPGAGRLIALGLWLLLGVMLAVWAALLWHPWIDWFGRPR